MTTFLVLWTLPCKKQMCVEADWTSNWRALTRRLARLSLFKSLTDRLFSSRTTTGEKSPFRSWARSALSATNHSRDTTELLDLRLSMEFQLTLRDSRMCVREKARKGRQSNTMHPPDAKSSEGVRKIWTNSLPEISRGSPIPMTSPDKQQSWVETDILHSINNSAFNMGTYFFAHWKLSTMNNNKKR